MATVHDVANYLTEKYGPLGTMKLEKLVYYCQGWYLARNTAPLFSEDLEAWKMGPVCRDLYALHRRKNWVAEWPQGTANELTALQKMHIDAVVDVYGAYSGFQLGSMTHQELPWNKAMAEGANTVISHEDMREYFRQMDVSTQRAT